MLVANEVVEEAKRKQKPCLVFKVDYEKAYDSVSWNFLFYMMKRMGFGPRWIKWIEGCLSSASVSILVNGVVDKLVCIQRRFLWGGGVDQHKIAWVKWETVCLPKDKEGLGIKDINSFNLALLTK